MTRNPIRLVSSAIILLFSAFTTSTVFANPQPTDLVVPGIIQAVNYDQGGEGTGFHLVSTAPTDKSYRADAARIAVIPGGGRAVELSEGDWLRYTADVKSAGTYTMIFRVAHNIGNDPLFVVECDGRDITGTMNAPFTGGMSKWVTLARPAVQLSAGKHTFTVKQVGGTPFFLDSIDITAGGTVEPGPKPDPKIWKLVWADEFKYTGKPDPAKWSYDIGGNGWGNQELEYYTDRLENARVENGELIIEARREDFQNNHYTSARLHTRGKEDITYGRVEVSAKLPAGAGNWPAIWLHGENGKPWPACGELDIMEHLGVNPGWIHGSAHTLKYYFKNGNQRTAITYLPQPDAAFHEYAIEWYPDHLDMFVDNNKFFTVVNDGTGPDSWPFDHPEYLILNLALGGWGGTVDDTQLPAKMEVKYVRVYQQAKSIHLSVKAK